MKLVCIIFISIVISACAQTTTTQENAKNSKKTHRFISSHQTHSPHLHKHGQNCGHETTTVGFDTVYLHDGHKHKVHGGHIDDIQ
jgi:hypothetical protein